MKQNFIKKVKDTNGIIMTEETDVGNVFKSHFLNIYTTVAPKSESIEACPKGIGRKVTNDMNASLEAPLQWKKSMKHLSR